MPPTRACALGVEVAQRATRHRRPTGTGGTLGLAVSPPELVVVQ
ncbi:hypothetical protein ACWEPC_41610 [Nonomuraea sp. NPDC004297]